MAQVICNDGTVEEAIVGESLVANCFSHGGIKLQHPVDKEPEVMDPEVTETITEPKGFTTTQKWLAVIGITAVCYFILHKAGSLK